MSHRLLRRGWLSYPGGMPTHLLSPMNASCPTSNSSSKTQSQHDWLAGNEWFLLSTHLTLAEGQESDENDLIAMCPRPFCSAALCWAVQCLPLHSPTTAAGSVQQEEIHASPRTVPHRCYGIWLFFLSQDGDFGGCACCISHFNILKEFSPTGLVMPLSQVCGSPSQAHKQCWWEQPWEQDSQRNILP